MKTITFYFVGICGISMYSLAIYLKKLGYNVYGSDINTKSLQYKLLLKERIEVYPRHDKRNIYQNNIDIVVYNNAVENNCEVRFAKQNKIKTISRGELLGYIITKYKHSICVSGAHGKSTTSAMIYNMLLYNNLNPNLHSGAFDLSGNSYYITPSDYFVIEACEYKDSFLHFFPNIAVILNIEKEHLDYFKTEKNIIASFKRFSNNSDILICHQKCLKKIEKDLSTKKIITFGERAGDFVAKNVKQDKYGISFDCEKFINGKYEFFDSYNLQLYGNHNAINCLACIAIGDLLKIDKKIIKQSLFSFKGIKRRFEIYDKNIPIIHDYAHHPSEIKETIRMTEKLFGKKILIVFEPHTYSRTKLLFNEFLSVFKDKNLLLLKTYSAREKYDYNGSAKYLSKFIEKSKYVSTYSNAIPIISNYIKKGYGILLLGAGTIDNLAEMLITKDSKKN